MKVSLCYGNIMSDRIIPFPQVRGASRRRKRASACPICGKPEVEAYRPFCSARCKQVDLGRWLGERYRLPSDEGPGESEPGEER
jgi:endogenous inhibitor of DNA gyrase (YacG/DUF329 family)